MRNLFITALLIGSSLFASSARAEDPPTFSQISAQTEQIGRAYFAAYIAREWDTLGTFLAENSSFADPTAAKIFGGVTSTGKSEMVEFFRTGYAGITEMSYQPQRELFSGNHAIFEGTLTWGVTLDGGLHVQTETMPFITILRVEDGLVSEHRDYADYTPFVTALRAARAAKAG